MRIHKASFFWLLISAVLFCGLVQFLPLYCTTRAMNSATADRLANAVARLGRNDASLTILDLQCKWHQRNGNTYAVNAGFMLTTRMWLHIDYRLERKALLLFLFLLASKLTFDWSHLQISELEMPERRSWLMRFNATALSLFLIFMVSMTWFVLLFPSW